jgi:hypothetical protein
MFHGLSDIVLGPSNKGGVNAKLGTVAINSIVINFYKYCIVVVGVLDYMILDCWYNLL